MNTLQMNVINARAAYELIKNEDRNIRSPALINKMDAEQALLDWAAQKWSIVAEILEHPNCLPSHRAQVIEDTLRVNV